MEDLKKAYFTSIDNDSNGNPRAVLHFLNIADDYEQALRITKDLGGKKYHNKKYGGGVVFSTYNLDRLINQLNEIKSNVEIYHTLRANKQHSKGYLESQLQHFANIFTEKMKDVSRVEFCKQDSRGVLSITVFNKAHCINERQIHFSNQGELLAFVQGYIHASRGW